MTADEESKAWEPPTTLLYLLKRAYLAARGRADEALQTHGLSVAEYAVLRRLAEAPGLSGAELARRCGVSAPTINGLLTGLEHDGLVERLPDPQGGRCILGRLTVEGERAVEQGHATVERLEELLLAEMDPTTQRMVCDELARIAATADDLRLRPAVGASR
jgi:DNA-binding MarR family transcriptional regulator